jgi:hypothetical protein
MCREQRKENDAFPLLDFAISSRLEIDAVTPVCPLPFGLSNSLYNASARYRTSARRRKVRNHRGSPSFNSFKAFLRG